MRAAILGLLLLCSPALAQKEADTLRVAWRDAIAVTDPYYNSQRTGLVLAHHVWDTLIYRDPDTLQLKPLLATSWKYVDDTTIDFTLRAGVTFHDGSAFTADDVAYTINTVIADPRVSVPSNYAALAGAEAIDDLHVRVRLKRVFPAALEYIAMVLPIWPHHYRERLGDAYALAPVGTGPYRVARVDGTAQIDLVRNDNYFDGPKGKPAIGAITLSSVPDAAAEIAALMGGKADWIWDFPPDQLDSINRQPTLQTYRSESMRVAYLNLDAAGRSGSGSPLTNLLVRQAVMHAVDRVTLARRFMPGGSRVLDAPCFPTQFGCDQAVATKYDYDPARARALLAEAGMPEGFSTTLVGYVQPDWMAAVAENLAAVGIRAEVVPLQVAPAVARSIAGQNPLEMGSWGSYSINDSSAFFPYFFSFTGQDYARDDAVRKLVDEAGSVVDPDRRRALYADAIRRITGQAYFLPLFTYVKTYASVRTLVFKPFGDEIPRFYMSSWR